MIKCARNDVLARYLKCITCCHHVLLKGIIEISNQSGKYKVHS